MLYKVDIVKSIFGVINQLRSFSERRREEDYDEEVEEDLQEEVIFSFITDMFC